MKMDSSQIAYHPAFTEFIFDTMTLLSRFVLLTTLVLASAGYSLAKTTVTNTPGNWTKPVHGATGFLRAAMP
jgi:hypothetical protein